MCKAAFDKLAIDYRAESPEFLASLKQEAEDATTIHKAGGISFGLVARAVRRAAAKTMTDGRRDELHDSLRALEQQAANFDGDISGRTDIIVKARRDSLILHRLDKNADYENGELVVQHRFGQGLVDRSKCVNTYHGLSRICDGLVSEPRAGYHQCFNFTPSYIEDVPMMLGFAERKCKSLLQECFEYFRRVTRMHLHHEKQPLPVKPKRNNNQKPPCGTVASIGTCLCGRHGDIKWACRAWLFHHIKAQFSRSDEGKAALAGGCVVVKIAVEFHSTYDALFSDSDHEVEHNFFQISHCSMNPFLPEFREATPLPNQDIDGCLQLNAVDRYYECYEFIDMLTRPTIADDERNDNLEIEFFKLIDDEMPVVDLDPRRLDVSRLDEPYGGDEAGARRRRLPRKHNTPVASSDVPPRQPSIRFRRTFFELQLARF